jgi:hypothetical protein
MNPLLSQGNSAQTIESEQSGDSDLTFCRRRTLKHARGAVYSRDAKARAAFTRKAAIWAELALAVEINPVSLASFRTSGELTQD